MYEWFKFPRRINSRLIKLIFTCIQWFPVCAFAEDANPFSQMGTGAVGILFGSFGLSICTIAVGASFLAAKFGKISWDQFLFIGGCTAGFIGTPSLISLISSWVGHSTHG